MPATLFTLRKRRNIEHLPRKGTRGPRPHIVDTALHAADKQRELLDIVRQLTVHPCPECSSAEIAGMLKEHETKATIRSVGRAMGILAQAGLVTSRTIRDYHLWRLTDKGRRALKEKP